MTSQPTTTAEPDEQPTAATGDADPHADIADEADDEHDSADDRRDRKYRAELRRTQSENAALRTALTEHVRGRVERLAAERGLADGTAVWLLDDDPLRYVDESYGVDADRVATAVDELLRRAPRLRAQVPDFDSGVRQPATPGPSWRQLLGGGS
ncbi:MAG: hypothetical protein ACM4D3_24695 [Candidatus Sericytochromatia bacterium]